MRRELQEEVGLELGAVRYAGAIENLYELDGHPGHEIVLVYDAELAPGTTIRTSYDVIEGGEAAWHAIWIPNRAARELRREMKSPRFGR